MSKTLIPSRSAEPLQLDYFETGGFDRFPDGLTHRKTCPHTIIAQVLAGAYEIDCRGERFRVGVGHVCVIPAQTEAEFVHRTDARGKMSSRWVHMHFSLFHLLDFLAFFKTPQLLSASAGRKAGRLIGQASQLTRDGAHHPSVLVRRHELALGLLKLLCAESSEPPRAIARSAHWHYLGQALEYMRRHLDEELTVSGLARAAGLSESHFHSIFREEFGVGPMRYVWDARLDVAARRLVVRQSSIAEIAATVGFNDPFHFSRAFKTRFGLSPRAYREQETRHLGANLSRIQKGGIELWKSENR